MTRPSLTEQIDSICWSDDSIALWQALMAFGPTDEGAAIVIAAAAAQLARAYPENNLADFLELMQLTSEFEDLALEMRRRLGGPLPTRRPQLRIVGGTDVG